MDVATLFEDEAAVVPQALRGVAVAGLTADSRCVRPGFVFAALPGSRADGARFIPDALAAGAVAVLADRECVAPDGAPMIRVEAPRRAFARAASRYFARQPERVLAVTGTSGKTSVASFARQILAACGRAAASLGTVGITAPGGDRPGALTTPDPVELHRLLAGLADEGVTDLAMEASSHGLDQRRLDGVRLAAGAFTNIGRDHLDYHPTPEAYFRAKLRLFEDLLPAGAAAVIDADRPESARIADVACRRGLVLLDVGVHGRTLRLVEARAEGFGQRLVVDAGGVRRGLLLPLAGSFQVSNALVAAALAVAAGVSTADALGALEALTGAPGRMELAGRTEAGAMVFIDYAHKPEAVENALGALRPFAAGRLLIVIGAGGDRDRGKRPLMGAAAVRNADVVYVTDDNPRSENPAAIRAEILAGAPGAIEVGDRRTAIETAIADLRAGDILLVAGKGHERGQVVGDRVLPFSDHEAVAAILAGDAAG